MDIRKMVVPLHHQTIRTTKTTNTMKANLILNAFNAHKYESIPNQFTTLHDRRSLLQFVGEGGKIHAIGSEGIPEGLYLYLYVDMEEQGELLDRLKEEAEKGGNKYGYINALVADCEGQNIALILCE